MINSSLLQHNRMAVIGGIVAMVVTLTVPLILGHISGYEAKVLIKNSIAGINTLCNTIVLASATILALLLTVLSLSSGSKTDLKDAHYKNVLNIAKLDTVVFVVSMITFLLLNIPITESEEIPIEYFTPIYYIATSLAAILSGALITVVLLLYSTISSIIQIVGLGRSDHPLLFDKEKDSGDGDDGDLNGEDQRDSNQEDRQEPGD